eukprot:252072-Amphidinium_carterae.1
MFCCYLGTLCKVSLEILLQPCQATSLPGQAEPMLHEEFAAFATKAGYDVNEAHAPSTPRDVIPSFVGVLVWEAARNCSKSCFTNKKEHQT